MQRACALLYQSPWRGLGQSPKGRPSGSLTDRILSASRQVRK